ncbi:nuclease-like protein [Scopulibacillus darangshiensis]|uniref:Nuclease-like protein n=1 Tax=Scopulibacillus darangshiensis TaxID=442528 RepID=A0A4R2NNX7_9BACL|nr:nuclease-related domain-containing protein [Scopulibacillus darangshiensis]TCP23430.1 nuclease-like protein [Scopulibacillus darangshiensis]
MPYKSRTESNELLILKALNARMTLSDKDKGYYFNLKKGYDGELLFDSLTEKLDCECLILNDLLLKVNNTVFQIDSLIIFSEVIHLFEVKNYDGDYFYEQERLYSRSKSEINNPLTQLSRSESLLRQLLQKLGFKIPIHSSVVFINPEFTLYQAPLDKPFIFPTQVSRFLINLNTTTSKLDRKHKMLADRLISLHIKDSPFKQLPAYDYDQLKKGTTCAKCSSFSITVEGRGNRTCICEECGYEELVDAAVMRSVDEFKLLYPNKKITTNVIHEWCGMMVSKKVIKRILDNNFKIVGVHQWVYYE